MPSQLQIKIRAERSSNPWCRLTSALDSRLFHRSTDMVPSLRVLPSCLRSRLRRSSSSAAFRYDARCWCISMSQCVHEYIVNLRAWVSAPHIPSTPRVLQAPFQTRLWVAPDWLPTEQAEVYGRCDPSVRTRDRRTEARTDRPHPSFPGVT